MNRNRIHALPPGLLGLLLLMGGFGTAPVSVADETAPEVPEAFESCISCHAYRPDEPALEGPTLWQVVGRRIASLDSFEYSAGLRKFEGTWDRATLDRFLAAPQAFAPGIQMTFGGLRNAADRAVVLDFLETLVPAQKAGDSER
jgi:cytochrome c